MTAVPAPSLAARLLAAPGEFDFVQAVDLLEQLARAKGAAPVPLGEGSDPSREAVSLRAPFESGFRPLPLEGLEAGSPEPPRLFVNFLGLAGSDGPLPEPYVDLVRAGLLAREHAGADFLGMFQHRLLSFAWRAADAARCARPFGAPETGPLAPALRALTGAPGEQAGTPLLAHLPAAVQARRSLHGLCVLLGRCFGMRVDAREATGRWTELPSELASRPGRTGRNHRLGRGAVLGRRVWQPDGAVELDCGTLPAALFRALLPGGARHKDLAWLCAWYLGPDLDCRIRVSCLREGPGCVLAGPWRLGQGAWLGRAPAVHAAVIVLAAPGAATSENPE